MTLENSRPWGLDCKDPQTSYASPEGRYTEVLTQCLPAGHPTPLLPPDVLWVN